jgi:uncharacterized protein YecT (DUF1311 family)
MRITILCFATCISVCCCAQNRSAPQETSKEKAHRAKQDIRAQGTAALNTEYARERAGRMNECPDANDTVSINKCMDEELATTQRNYIAYIRSIGGLLRLGDPDFPNLPAIAKDLDKAERSWTAYREMQCRAYQHLDPGSIQVSNYFDCEISLTRTHLHELESLYKKDLWE